MYIKLQLPTSENKTRPRKFQSARKYMVQHRKMVNIPHQNQILHSSWLTSRNATPSIGSLYKLPTLFAPFLFCDVIADKVYCSYIFNMVYLPHLGGGELQVPSSLHSAEAAPTNLNLSAH